MMKRLKITVDGVPYDVTVEEIDDTASRPTVAAPAAMPAPAASPHPSTAAQPPSPASAGAAPGQVASPLAGKVLEVLVGVGAAVKAGDAVLRLEAMKMESMVVAPNSGTVKSVDVGIGDSVQEGQVLVTIG
jgi:biotin carboxyl carrier protein